MKTDTFLVTTLHFLAKQDFATTTILPPTLLDFLSGIAS
jgi:hypothetical protein